MLMSLLLRHGFTSLLLLFLTAVLLHPVDTTAQNLPGWAEPSEQRQSRFESREYEPRTENTRPPEPQKNPLGPNYNPQPITNEKPPWTGPPKTCGECGPDEQCCQKNDGSKTYCAVECGSKGTPIPVDDYLPLLMLAGIAYAALRLRR